MADGGDQEINKTELSRQAQDMNAAMTADSLAMRAKPLSPDTTPQQQKIKLDLRRQSQDMNATMTADSLRQGATPLTNKENPTQQNVPGETDKQ